MNNDKLERFVIIKWCTVPILVATLFFVWIAADGGLHWDEPGYLYAGAYQSFDQIITGDIQPSGEAEFTIGRILHLLFIHGLMVITDNSKAVFEILIIVHLVLIGIMLWLSFKIQRILIPEANYNLVANLLVAMSPIIIYLSFKTLPDTASLSMSTLVAYSLLRRARGDGVIWIVIAMLGLAASALTKAQAVLLPFGFWTAGCLCPISPMDRKRLFWSGILAGIGAIFITSGTLELLGIGATRYWASYMTAVNSALPLTAKILNIYTELGLLWAILVVSFMSSRKKGLKFFWLWFSFSMLPLIILIRNLEPRHIAVNLIAAGGIFALSTEVFVKRFSFWQKFSIKHKSITAALGIIVLMLSNWLTIAIMPHEVEIRQIDKMLQTLNHRYNFPNYTIITPWDYTTFNILRVLWPKVDVRDIATTGITVNEDRVDRKCALEKYLHGRYYDNLAEMRAEGQPIVLLGYVNTFSAENMRKMLLYISPALEKRIMGNLKLVNHLHSKESRWFWSNPDVTMKPIANIGHYLAFEIRFASKDLSLKKDPMPK